MVLEDFLHLICPPGYGRFTISILDVGYSRVGDIGLLHDFASFAFWKVFDVHHQTVNVGSDCLEALMDFIIDLGECFLGHLLAFLGLNLKVNVVSDC